MLDKLVIVSQKIKSPETVRAALSHITKSTYSTNNRFYNSVQVGKAITLSGKEGAFVVSCEATHPNISPLRIELNPSKFSSFNEVLESVSTFDSPESFKICRIDHAVDLEIPIDDIYRSIVNTRKRIRVEYAQGRELTGFYLGNRPELLSIYDRGLKEKLNEVCTRVELRQWNEKIPVSSLCNLEDLKDLDVFQNIKFWELVKPEEIEDQKRAKYQKLYDETHAYGAMGAYKRLNKQWNFKRDFGKHFFRINQRIPDLNSIYQTELQSFFEGGENGFRQANCS